MIEDLQDEYSLYTQKKTSGNRKSRIFMILFLFWIIYSTVIILISMPAIRRSLRKTEALEILANLSQYRTAVESKEGVLYFCSISDELKPYKVLLRTTGSTEYHDAVEGLLRGPDDSVLEEGSVTCIDRGTRLLGLTVSERTAFVNFSQPIASEEEKDLARSQIFMTLRAVNPALENLVVLVNGNPAD